MKHDVALSVEYVPLPPERKIAWRQALYTCIELMRKETISGDEAGTDAHLVVSMNGVAAERIPQAEEIVGFSNTGWRAQGEALLSVPA